MNSYTLTAESRRWWWPSAAAGVAASSAIAVIAFVPVTTYAASSEPRDRAGAVSAPIANGSDDIEFRSCFMMRPNWNLVLDGPPPRCVISGRGVFDVQATSTAEARGPRRLAVGV
jgi:hypothetical protein